ncbi:MAG: glycosyltransferase family 4 protein [Xanthomonadales bacterium]|nr:hypothetical protein [Xanthomonadales bacterium]MCC6593775.1 glycosyltransferase family 4 protein [Xanthomonadales bacterium]
MRIFVINQWLPPDPAPTAVLAGEVADALRAAGHEVVLVSRARADALPPSDAARLVIDHLPAGRTGLLAKLAAWPRFAWRMRRALRERLRAGDCVLVCSDPPLAWPIAVAAARRAGARCVHWSQDVYPEVVAAHWPAPWLRRLLAPLRAWRDRWLRRADCVVAISEGMGARLRAAGASVAVVPNWARDEQVRARPHGDSQLRRAHFRDDEFVLMYSGNLGRVHEFETLLGAARLLRGEPRIRFLVVGAGPRLPALREAVAREALGAFIFLPLQSSAQLADTLAAGDAHLVSLRPAFEGLVLPSKLYGIAAVGRPVLFCGDPQGETAHLVRAHDCGIVVAEGAAAELATALRTWVDDRPGCVRMGRNARALLEAQALRAQALARWREVVEGRAA